MTYVMVDDVLDELGEQIIRTRGHLQFIRSWCGELETDLRMIEERARRLQEL
jgi:hypothetical protein